MLRGPNALQWDGRAGHYEVYYLTVTEPRTGVGLWIRYTMLAPLRGEASCSLWFLAMDPRGSGTPLRARKLTLPVSELRPRQDPFELVLGEARLSDRGMAGAFEDVAWELRWEPAGRPYEHVHPLLRRAKAAQTILVLPHADLAIDGKVTFGGEDLELSGARGGQAHLWGTKHAHRWAWVHCNDFATPSGEPVGDAFVDGVSVVVNRGGRQVGPSTPVLGRFEGEDFACTEPWRVVRSESSFALTGWRFEALDGARKLVAEVDARRDQLAGVTYHDPDGQPAYCYNSETASMRLHLYERARRVGGWLHRRTLVAPGRAHFEYGQRVPVADLPVLL